MADGYRARMITSNKTKRWLSVLAPTTAAAGAVWWIHRTVTSERPRGVTLSGRPWKTMAQIRDEHAQAVLADAARDPELDRMLDEAAARVLDDLNDARSIFVPVRRLLLAYANGYAAALTDPPEVRERVLASMPRLPVRRSEPVGFAYGEHSPSTVAVAAICRLDELLRNGR